MKRRIAAALLLFLSFVWLALCTGVIPVAAEAEAAGVAEKTPTPMPEKTPIPTRSEDGTANEEIFPTEAPEDIEIPEESPTEDSHLTLIATTITSDSPLDNDTYYDIDPAAVPEACPALPAEGVQILIVHTHTTEAYTPTKAEAYVAEGDYHTTDQEHSVVRVGEALAEALRGYGLRVMHDTTIHDYPSYNGSYARSGETVEECLAAHPEIALVIDLHRDALGDDDVVYKPLADVDGLEAAQLMFVVGTDINLENPDWRGNLSLALTLQSAIAARYPTLMRPVSLCASRYNQQLLPGGSLLLEVGANGNTLEEAIAGVGLFAQIVGPLLASWVV